MRTLALALALALTPSAGCGPSAPVVKKPDPVEIPVPTFDWGTFPRVDIIDASYLVLPADLTMMTDLKGTLTEAGVAADEIDGVIKGAEEAAWPGPFADLNQRYYLSGEIGLIRARHVAYLEGDWVMLAVLADENQHLKPEVRPQHDFFAVFVEWGVQPIDRVPPRPGTQLDAGKFAAVKVVDPDKLFPYAGVRYLERAEEILLGAGVPQTALEQIYNRSEEIGWPRELRWDRRPANVEAISKYKGRKIAELGRNVLVLISADENQHMPDALRPSYDFYFLVEAAGVAKR